MKFIPSNPYLIEEVDISNILLLYDEMVIRLGMCSNSADDHI